MALLAWLVLKPVAEAVVELLVVLSYCTPQTLK
jgi:hypothetical protein